MSPLARSAVAVIALLVGAAVGTLIGAVAERVVAATDLGPPAQVLPWIRALDAGARR